MGSFRVVFPAFAGLTLTVSSHDMIRLGTPITYLVGTPHYTLVRILGSVRCRCPYTEQKRACLRSAVEACPDVARTSISHIPYINPCSSVARNFVAKDSFVCNDGKKIAAYYLLLPFSPIYLGHADIARNVPHSDGQRTALQGYLAATFR